MTKQEIVDRSFELFRVYGVKSVTLDDISGKLGVSKRTLYDHFKSKEDILLTGLRSIFDRIAKNIQVILESKQDPIEKLMLIYHGLLTKMIEYTSSYYFTINRFSDQITNEIHSFKEDIINDYSRSLLERAQVGHLLIDGTNINLFIRLYLDNLDARTPLILNDHPKVSLNDLFYHLIEVPVNGICKRRYTLEKIN